MELYRGDSYTIGIKFNDEYSIERIQEIELNIGSITRGKLSDNSLDKDANGVFVCKIPSEKTMEFYSGKYKVTLHVQDEILGIKKQEIGKIDVKSSNNKTSNESINALYDALFVVKINETQITVEHVFRDLLKGDPFRYTDFTPEQLEALKVKGDSFTYEDFTPEQLEALKVKGDKGDTGNIGITGVAATSTMPISTGFHRYEVHTAGTYTNFKDASNASIVVTAADLAITNGVQGNEVVLEVQDNVVVKRVYAKKGDKGDAADPAKLPLYSAIKSANIVAGTQFIDDENDNVIYRVKTGQTLLTTDIPANVVGMKVDMIIPKVEYQDVNVLVNEGEDILGVNLHGTNVSLGTNSATYRWNNIYTTQKRVAKSVEIKVQNDFNLTLAVITNNLDGTFSFSDIGTFSVKDGYNKIILPDVPLNANQTIGFKQTASGQNIYFNDKSYYTGLSRSFQITVGQFNGYLNIVIYTTAENSDVKRIGKSLAFNSDYPASAATGFYYAENFVKTQGRVKKIYYNANNISTVKLGIVTEGVNPSISNITEFSAVVGVNTFTVDWELAAGQTIGISKTSADKITFYLNVLGESDYYIDFETNRSKKGGWIPLLFDFETKYDFTDLKKITIDNQRQPCVIVPEHYGAKPINPNDPDNSMDCTSIFQNILDKIAKDPDNDSFVIELAGIYRLGLNPNTRTYKSQLLIPNVAYMQRPKSIFFKGLLMPLYEDQGEHVVPMTIGGSGFYSSHIETVFNNCAVIRSSSGGGGGIMGDFNYVGVKMDNLAVYIKTGNGVVNNMSAIDMERAHMFEWGSILVRTTSQGYYSAEPNAGTFGLKCPRISNHATVVGNYLRSFGFGTGLITGEHLTLNYYASICCQVGLTVTAIYPTVINHIALETNKVHIMIENGASLISSAIQFENYTKPEPKWYAPTGNRVQKLSGVAGGSIVAGMIVNNNSGGIPTALTIDEGIKYRYMMDQSGNSKLT